MSKVETRFCLIMNVDCPRTDRCEYCGFYCHDDGTCMVRIEKPSDNPDDHENCFECPDGFWCELWLDENWGSGEVDWGDDEASW